MWLVINVVANGRPERRGGLMERSESGKKPESQEQMNQNVQGYSSATLPPAVPRRPPPLVKLPVWAAVLVWIGLASMIVAFSFWVARRPIASPAVPPSTVEVINSELWVRKMPTAAPAPVYVWARKIQAWESEIIAAADAHKLSPDLVAAIVQIESNGDPAGVSYAGAVGMMGVMPRGSGAGLDGRPSAETLLNPQTNLDWGAKIFAQYLQQANGDLALGLAAYNGGWGYAGSVQTQTYALEVLNIAGRSLAARAGVENAAAVWGISWEICPCKSEPVVIDRVEIRPTVLFNDGLRVEGVPLVVVVR